MHKLTLLVVVFFVSISLFSQQSAYTFTVVKENPVTSVKNQASSGTCWSFSGVSFLESELLRKGKGTFDLSEMYIVRRNYEDKAEKYVRTHGNLNFAPGGSFADVIETLDQYGVVPDEVYTGLLDGAERHDHGEMDKVLSGYMKGIIGNNSVSTVWKRGFNGILDAYLGAKPDSFTYNGKTYTPQSFKEFLELDQNDYISITSFSHQPFYTYFPLEVPDNWRWANSFNLPLDEMMAAIDHALMNGYTVAWASDVSEGGFSRQGIAIVPDENAVENAGTDQAKWLGLSERERRSSIAGKVGSEVLKEKTITQEMRQLAYDNYQTTDDHGMHIYGIAKDQNGNKFYLVKNSWGETGPYNGVWYASEAFVRYKTTSIVMHKDALPKATAKKL
ncbi:MULTISPECIES: C1 family peptidase [Petrimonas]|jgi:aminopeptidase C|uniref:Aminopeptidase n=3 Tax=Petrimonas mucosa TaxID=1642646 RepID=A0A1G4G9T2_9BACT|nr:MULTISPECIES: C1 family peptidase [Petrimonas]MDD3559923.1 C1 family peptidase [Petrimonas mucosa]SCM59303.1 putative peptidase {ECO:0000313/EMBL:CEA14943,1} [Petrimonas mucosa]SFU44491.1 Aminopeptidase C [Porphyromonadaceae bacterium KHP3R9]HHT28891.1 aminopeptidase [Petrimonas mucosa]